jgi:hypothetical protein
MRYVLAVLMMFVSSVVEAQTKKEKGAIVGNYIASQDLLAQFKTSVCGHVVGNYSYSADTAMREVLPYLRSQISPYEIDNLKSTFPEMRRSNGRMITQMASKANDSHNSDAACGAMFGTLMQMFRKFGSQWNGLSK